MCTSIPRSISRREPHRCSVLNPRVLEIPVSRRQQVGNANGGSRALNKVGVFQAEIGGKGRVIVASEDRTDMMLPNEARPHALTLALITS